MNKEEGWRVKEEDAGLSLVVSVPLANAMQL